MGNKPSQAEIAAKNRRTENYWVIHYLLTESKVNIFSTDSTVGGEFQLSARLPRFEITPLHMRHLAELWLLQTGMVPEALSELANQGAYKFVIPTQIVLTCEDDVLALHFLPVAPGQTDPLLESILGDSKEKIKEMRNKLTRPYVLWCLAKRREVAGMVIRGKYDPQGVSSILRSPDEYEYMHIMHILFS